MQLSHLVRIPHQKAQGMLVLLLLSSSFLLSACGGHPQVRQEANSAQARFTQVLQHARQIGVPTASLRQILQQQQQLLASSAPFNLFDPFNDQAADGYYRNLATRYTQLTAQVQIVIIASTAQARKQTLQDLQSLQDTLQRRRAQDFPVQRLSEELAQAQSALPQARVPLDYARISGKVHDIQRSLTLMVNLSSALASLNQSIALLQQAHLDVADLMISYQKDKEALGKESTLAGFKLLQARVHAQTQQALTNMTQAIPALVTAKISTFSQQLKLLQKAGIAISLYQTHQTKFRQDSALVHDNMNLRDYQTFAAQIDKDTMAALFDQLHINAQNTLLQFHNDAQSWNNAHAYYDSYDGQNYPLNAGYLDQGVGSDLDAALAQARSVDDLRNVIRAINNAQFNLQLLKSDYSDSTPYNQIHQTDRQALDHYQLQKGQVIVVSMVEQALRLYQDGKLVRAFQITTGRYDRPSLPGLWLPLARQSPTIFRSSDPPSSSYWFPPTPINYAILYHEGGYFIHDSWWRSTYGPGTQFPHGDASGDQSFAGNGSHGCINVREDEAAWLYNNTSWETAIIVY
jgi:lipoprotein-anchoring transpeptidase ErfK/SrfK